MSELSHQQTDVAPSNENSEQLIPENYIGALDIGSNSFHFVFARVVDDNLQVLHSEKYQVKLADGLSNKNILSDDAIARGVETLKNIAPLIDKLTTDNFRVVATYTLRQAKNAKAFLKAAAEVFPFDIEIVSGHEEARLIFQGVTHNIVMADKHLVVDIGGGSTEFIIGKNENIYNVESLNIGCVNLTRMFFADGKMTKGQFKKAILHATLEIENIVKRFQKTGWKVAIGTSGTIKSIFLALNQQEQILKPITLADLHALKQQLIDINIAENIEITGIKETRKTIIASGLSILIAIMDTLDVNALDYCDYALREGLLYEILDTFHCVDIRQRTINSLSTRFSIDEEQGEKVTHLANELFSLVSQAWHLTPPYQRLLRWAAQLHEIGFDINSSGYQKHGKYILQNADLAGFNQEQQQALAWLVGNHRKKITTDPNETWYLLNNNKLIKTCIILRLAVLLNQQRQLSQLPEIIVNIDENQLTIAFPHDWFKDKKLIQEDLQAERQLIYAQKIKLLISTY